MTEQEMYILDLEEENENLTELNRVLTEKIVFLEEKYAPRKCSACGKGMYNGFLIGDGLEYYCSEKCLHTKYTEEEYLQMYEDEEAFYTEWEDEE